MFKTKCPICNTKIDDDQYSDCPYCGWGYTGHENMYEDNEIEPFNKMSKIQAKKLLSQGLNIWGKPLPQK